MQQPCDIGTAAATYIENIRVFCDGDRAQSPFGHLCVTAAVLHCIIFNP